MGAEPKDACVRGVEAGVARRAWSVFNAGGIPGVAAVVRGCCIFGLGFSWLLFGGSTELLGQNSAKQDQGSGTQESAQKGHGQEDGGQAEQDQNKSTGSEATAADQGDGKTRDLTFDSIQFPMEPGEKFRKEMLTKEIIALDKQIVRIRGFIRPSFKQSGLSKFVFVRDNQECCFGPGAALYDCILVELADGVETDYTLRPITILGTFYFKSYKGPDGEIWAIYRMREATVE